MFAEERLLRIVEMVSRNGKVTVAELCEALAVSQVTIRRDLERLEEEKLLLRTHGGAIAPERQLPLAVQEKSFSEKEEAYVREKERIAEAASQLVSDDEAILLTPGTTNMFLARKLIGKKRLTVVTNAANIAMQIGHQADWNVILTGGKMRQKSFALVGPMAESSLSKVKVDKLFLGVDGWDPQAGLTTPNLEEASVNRQMISIARQVILVADHSKFGRVCFAQIAGLESVHTIITDQKLSEEKARLIDSEFHIPFILV